MKRSVLLVAGALATAVLSTHVSAAPANAAAGRDLVKRYADAIVGVELVVTVKMKMGDREAPPREQRIEINGTVISASGLTVTTLAEVDPQTAFEAMRANAPGGSRIELVGADFKEVKLRLADGTEVPARFVLKDADLDLAFMAPDLSATDVAKKEYAYVKLDDVAQGEVLGEYFNLSRAPKVLQRVPMIRASQITGIVEKPRRVHLVSDQTVGTPTFDLQGKVLGISLQHFANGRRTGLVVVPAGDIAEMAKQAAAAQAAPAK
jgi:hypothetical protein